MSNYYTKYSFALSLPNEQAQKYAADLVCRLSIAHDEAQDREEGDRCEPDDIPREFWPELAEWNPGDITPDGSDSPGIWVHSDECGDPYHAALFVQHLLKKYWPRVDPHGCLTAIEFQYSNDCDKPRLDAFGGGAYYVTAETIDSMNTRQWLDQRRKGTEVTA